MFPKLGSELPKGICRLVGIFPSGLCGERFVKQYIQCGQLRATGHIECIVSLEMIYK